MTSNRFSIKKDSMKNINNSNVIALNAVPMIHQSEKTEEHKKRERRVEFNTIDRNKRTLKSELRSTSTAPGFIVQSGRGSGNLFMAMAKTMDDINKGSLMQEYAGALEMRAENAVQKFLNCDLGKIESKMQSALYKLNHPPHMSLGEKIGLVFAGIVGAVVLTAVMGPLGDLIGGAMSAIGDGLSAVGSAVKTAVTTTEEVAEAAGELTADVPSDLNLEGLFNEASESTESGSETTEAPKPKSKLRKMLPYGLMATVGGITGYTAPAGVEAGKVKQSNTEANGNITMAQTQSMSVTNKESITNNGSQQIFSTDESDQLQDQNFAETSISGIFQGMTSTFSGNFRG